jgi:hypothetical protein
METAPILIMMRQQSLVILLFLLLNSLTACSPGHLGSTVIAFIRNGHLWTIDPNGANAFEIVAQDTPVVGYSWSPMHQILAFRTLDADFAKTSAAKHLTGQPMTGLIKDTPSVENTIGVDGGTPIPIAFSSPTISSSNAIWNTNGTRLLYRQTTIQGVQNNSTIPQWFISQSDQPGGIALKSFLPSYSIPSFSYLNQRQLVLGNGDHGIFMTTLAGTNVQYLTHAPLLLHPLPASLERVLWQPAHQDRRFLYAMITSQKSAQQEILAGRPSVQLILSTVDGQTTTLATCACIQFAWSPDGNSVLYSTGATYTILNLSKGTSWKVSAEEGSIPYWSPDSQFLLLDGVHTLQLLSIAEQHQYTLLSDEKASKLQPEGFSEQLSSPGALLQPITNSVWSADSRHFLFLTQNRFQWQSQSMHIGKGLYTVAIDNYGHPQGTPILVDAGDDSQAGWTYQDANTSFLY